MNEEEFSVSVIVPVYNGEADLPELLSCLQGQRFPAGRVEYLLVDNKSSDRTPDILEAAQAETPAIKPLREKEIQSSYAARNRGIKAATGDILAFTDADCRPQPDWLANLIAPFRDPSIGIVAGEIAALPGKTLLEKYADRQKTLSQKHTLTHPFCAYGQTANLGIRRSALERVGIFRPYLTTGGDADICWRILRETDWQLKFAPTAIVRHRHRQSMKELESQWRRYGRSNLYLHELHGVKLMPEMTGRDYLYRLSRWLLKELPITMVKTTLGKATVVDLVSTPIGLFTAKARYRGQQEAKLPEAARKIEWL
ncbi:MAG: glycosyltransferase [Hormoscilla sp. GUM202]|nr:glycosyltransferase [Hormoscilla sp. GUM202]